MRDKPQRIFTFRKDWKLLKERRAKKNHHVFFDTPLAQWKNTLIMSFRLSDPFRPFDIAMFVQEAQRIKERYKGAKAKNRTIGQKCRGKVSPERKMEKSVPKERLLLFFPNLLSFISFQDKVKV